MLTPSVPGSASGSQSRGSSWIIHIHPVNMTSRDIDGHAVRMLSTI
jgi:hypothetical protein